MGGDDRQQKEKAVEEDVFIETRYDPDGRGGKDDVQDDDGEALEHGGGIFLSSYGVWV